MVGSSNRAAACQEEGCVELLPAAAPEEAAAQPGMLESSLQRPPWRPPAVVVAVSAATVLLVGAVAMAATRGKPLSNPAAAVTSDSLVFFSEPYEDPQGQTVCPASVTSKGSCKCQCAWTKAIGACAQRRDDGTCCYSCCCPSAGEETRGQSEMGYFREHGDAAYHAADNGGGYYADDHGDTAYHNVDGGAYHADMGKSVHTTVHATQHYDHYHAITEDSFQTYRVGEHVYVKASDGRAWAAEIVAVNADGTYRVRYLANERYGGRSVLVSSSHIVRQRGGFFGPQLWWLIFGGILVMLCGLGCFLFWCPRS